MKYLLISLITIVVLVWTGTAASYGQQGTATLVISHLLTTEAADRVGLQVYFTPIDQTGRPILDVQLEEEGSVQLLGAGVRPTTASIYKPNEPIYIALLLDASGSMLPLIDQVKAAASSALERAPANARFAVIQFNDLPPTADLQVLQDFTPDLNFVRKGIQDVQAEDGAPTCLYNATDKAIELLRQQMAAQERGAVLLFTDGRDERADGTICSNRTIEEVTYTAVGSADADIPIHTIGLCTDSACTNIDRTALAGLAKDTQGFSAIGSQTNLSTMFEQIMDGLNSQWVATADVYPRKGTNKATLNVQTSGQNAQEFTTLFAFDSSVDTLSPPPPATAIINNFQPLDEATYDFTVSVNSNDPSSIQQVIIQVYNEHNIQVDEQVLEPDALARPVRLDASGLATGEHKIQVKAVDQQNNLIPNAEGEFVLAEWEFTHQAPPAKTAPTFTIQTVDADPASNELLIGLGNLETGVFYHYQGYIRVTEEGGKADELPSKPLEGNQIKLPLPDAMRNLASPTEYTLYLTLERSNEGIASPEQTFTFTVQPKSQPGFFEGLSTWVKANAVLLIFIFSAGLALLFWRFYTERRREQENLKIKRPEARTPPTDVAHTNDHLSATQRTSSKPSTGQLITPRLLVQTGESASKIPRFEQELSHFPCVIGRNEKLAHGRVTPRGKQYYLNLLGDAKISREHLEIKLQGGQFYVTHLKSTNKTKLNGQLLEPAHAVALTGLSQIQLGPDTHLEIQPFI